LRGVCMIDINALFTAYADTLRKKNAELGGYYWGNPNRPALEQKTPEEVAEKMFNAVWRSSYPSDWLRYNEALKEACKAHGIRKSAELRELVKAAWMPRGAGSEKCTIEEMDKQRLIIANRQR
jgi:hypothetical protein